MTESEVSASTSSQTCPKVTRRKILDLVSSALLSPSYYVFITDQNGLRLKGARQKTGCPMTQLYGGRSNMSSLLKVFQ